MISKRDNLKKDVQNKQKLLDAWKSVSVAKTSVELEELASGSNGLTVYNEEEAEKYIEYYNTRTKIDAHELMGK